MTLPNYTSKLSAPVQINNFTPIQSAQLNAGAMSTSVTFTLVPGTNRVTFKITNTDDTNGAYLATGIGSATAVASSGTPTPASSVDNAVATCDYIAPGAILTQDYVQGTNTIAALSAGGALLEISIGTGQ